MHQVVDDVTVMIMYYHDGMVVVAGVITCGYIFTTYYLLLQLVIQASYTSVPINILCRRTSSFFSI